MMEAGVLIDLQGNPIHWHLPPGRSVGYLPDSEDLWQVIWKNKDNISGFAHSHPGIGDPGPSWTDITTFSGIELALGRRLKWWIISSDSIALVEWANKDKYTYTVNKCDDDFVWLKKLHDVSYNELMLANCFFRRLFSFKRKSNHSK